jgi:tRNA(adenine34) deaminase
MMDLDFEALDHEYFMREALKEAVLAGQAGEMPIGAVIVHQGQVVGRGRAQHRTRQSEIAHAELNALLQAEQFIYAHVHDGCILYTTLEPCVMCLGAVAMSDMEHIVYAMTDNWMKPKPMLEVEHVRRHIKKYVGGILEKESIDLWERFDPRGLKMLQEGRVVTT